MILRYFSDPPNAGDSYNLDYLRFFLEKFSVGTSLYAKNTQSVMFCGSIIDYLPDDGVCCGLGLINPVRAPNKLTGTVISVRGPLTLFHCKQMIAHDNRILLGDPGVLASEVLATELELTESCSDHIGVIPHYVDKPHVWKLRSKHPIEVIDIQQSAADVFSKIKGCKHIYSSSLHGIIFAHAAGVPATWVEFGDGVVGDGFKFYDYYLSLGVGANEVVRKKITEPCDVSSLKNKHALPNTSAIKQEVMFSLYSLAEFILKSAAL